MATIKIASSIAEFDSLEKIWGNLLSCSPSNNYFITWDWLRQWWKIYANPGDKLAIFLFEKQSEIIGIAPLYIRKRNLFGIYPVRRMMFIGTQKDSEGDVCSDYLDIIYREGEEKTIISLLFETFSKLDICDEFYLSKMDTAAKTFTLFQEEADKRNCKTTVVGEYTSPYIELPTTWDQYLASLAPSMRYKIKKERKKLEQSGNVVVSKVENISELSKGFDELDSLHRKRWESKGAAGAFMNQQFCRFHREIMPTMLLKKYLELTVLSENGKSKAIFYNVFYNNKIYFYQSGVDTSDRKTAFGYALHSYCIEDAIKRGLREYDYLPKGSSDDYKDRFAKHSRTVSDLSIIRTLFLKQYTSARETARSLYHYANALTGSAERDHGTK